MLFWLSYVAAVLHMLAALALPVISVLVATRERQRLHPGMLTPGSVVAASVVLAVLTPIAASILTPDWSPVTWFLLAAGPWSLIGWSFGFWRSYRNGFSVPASSGWGLATAVAAPFVGSVLVVLRVALTALTGR